MIDIGKYNELTILRHTSVGLYLGDEEGEERSEDAMFGNELIDNASERV